MRIINIINIWNINITYMIDKSMLKKYMAKYASLLIMCQFSSS